MKGEKMNTLFFIIVGGLIIWAILIVLGLKVLKKLSKRNGDYEN
jgi:tetrahydromethanopterin S-methyltransferase subunit E